MNNENQNEPGTVADSDQALAQLLRQVGPRPRPSDDAEQRTRDAVHAHWQSNLQARRRRRLLSVAAAATVVLALKIAFRPADETGPVTGSLVATLERAGSSYQLSPATDTPGLHVAQVLQSGDSEPLALRWNSGEVVRVSPGSRLRVISPVVLELEYGTIYLDMAPELPDPTNPLTIRTTHGDIHHLGTQFLVRQQSDHVLVAVREGKVTLSLDSKSVPVSHGEQVTLSAQGETERSVVPTHGGLWAWAESAAATYDLNDMPLHEFLDDVARETGHQLVYADPQLQAVAHRETFTGRVDQPPRQALALVLSTTELAARFADGRLMVERR